MKDIIKCRECMKSAPYTWCCKTTCGKREACKGCTHESRGTVCPNDGKYYETKEDVPSLDKDGCVYWDNLIKKEQNNGKN